MKLFFQSKIDIFSKPSGKLFCQVKTNDIFFKNVHVILNRLVLFIFRSFLKNDRFCSFTKRCPYLPVRYYWRPTDFYWRPQAFHRRPQILIRNPKHIIGDPNLFIGDPNLFIGDPNLFIGDPNLFTGDPNPFTGDPNLFIAIAIAVHSLEKYDQKVWKSKKCA